jgi:hypothetical protein
VARRHIEDRKVDPKSTLSFTDHWNLPDVRGALYAIHGNVCGYCGCGLPRNDRGDVDHYRPKARVVEDNDHGGYWWLAYNASNYLLSCSVCNRVRKRDHFPLRLGARHYRFAQRSQLRQEARIILNPLLDPVEDWLKVDWQDRLCPLSPHDGLPPKVRSQIDGTLKLFKLNTDARLVKSRRKVVAKVLRALGRSRMYAATVLAIRYRPMSLVAWAVLRDRAPHCLPTPEQELNYLLRRLATRVDFASRLVERYPTDLDLRNELTELLWSLAVLWYDPPKGNHAQVDAFLRDQMLVDHVRPYFDKL